MTAIHRPIIKNKPTLEEDRDFWKSRAIDMESVLLNAKEKLRLYREAHGGEYVGGVEYMELMRRVDAALTRRS